MSSGDHILTLNETARILTGCDVVQLDLATYWPKERNTAAEKDGKSSDDEALDEPCLEKASNGDPAVDIEMLRAAFG